jgi:TRAP-type transport system small permease protein
LNVFLIIMVALTALLLWRHVRAEGEAGSPLSLWQVMERSLAVFLLLGMVLATVFQVGIRYGLHQYVRAPWTDELSRLFMVWLVFWGATILHRTDEHIHMGLLVNKLPDLARRIVRLFGDLCTLAIFGILVWYGFQTAQGAMRLSSLTLGVPMAVFHYSVPVSGALMFLYSCLHVVARVRGREIEPEQDILEVE